MLEPLDFWKGDGCEFIEIGDEIIVSGGDSIENGDEFSDEAHRLTWAEGILATTRRLQKCISGWKGRAALGQKALTTTTGWRWQRAVPQKVRPTHIVAGVFAL